MTRDICRQLVALDPAGNGAAYRAGQDVRGKPVTPADLRPSPTHLGPGLKLEFDIPLRTLRPDVADELANIDLKLGILDYDPQTGTLSLNGDQLAGRAAKEIREKCRAYLQK